MMGLQPDSRLLGLGVRLFSSETMVQARRRCRGPQAMEPSPSRCRVAGLGSRRSQLEGTQGKAGQEIYF